MTPSCVRLYDMKTDMMRVVKSKVQPQLGLASNQIVPASFYVGTQGDHYHLTGDWTPVGSKKSTRVGHWYWCIFEPVKHVK
jgi:hypothetical protein